MKKFLLATATAIFCVPAIAASEPTGSGVDFFAGKADLEFSDSEGSFEPEGSEFGLRGRIVAPNGFLATASYEAMKTDAMGIDTDLDELHFGAGFRRNFGAGAVGVEAHYVKYELEFSADGESISGETDGFGIYGHLSGRVSDSVTLYTNLGYVSVEDDSGSEGTGYDVTAGISATVAKNVSLFGEYRRIQLDADEDDVEISADNLRVGVTVGF